ncbi:PREDICTED: uncharacterized protein LOC104706586 [Camelina sativa]|uniref:Uncharacterized protein LOC104706586 n=1 Tax=Camelina sativa TaxID=90675 RepID=A0ABM0T5A5_CAMSA|nr:PREDICTED: uncharacterized protein LOC104706586 [Camelina sativa]
MPPITSSSRRSLRHVIFFIFTIIFIIALGVFITWLVTKRKKLHYSVEYAFVQNFTLTNENYMSATFKITIQSYNPNHQLSVYYTSVQIFVQFKDQTLAFDTKLEPFQQPRMNVALIDDALIVQNVRVSESSGEDLRVQASLGNIDFEVFVKARVRFIIGFWWTAHRTANIECSHVTFSLSQLNNSQHSSCYANL